VPLGRASLNCSPFMRRFAQPLTRAIAATFERRETEVPVDRPDALTPAFAEDEQKQRQWNAFLDNVVLRPGSLPEVIEGVARFLMPHAIAAAKLGRSD